MNNIVASNKIKGNNKASKFYIGYLDDTGSIVTYLCIILPQMSGYFKYFENGRKNISSKIDDESVYVKYQIWNKIKELLDIKLYSEPIYDDSYIKTKVKIFSDIIKTLFNEDEISKERVEYACIACISFDSVLKVNGKSYSQVYLEQCKHKIKKRQVKSFIDDYKIDLDSDYEVINNFLDAF